MIHLPETDFRPYPLLWSGHAQTVFAGLWNTCDVPHTARCHILPTDGSDRLALHDDVPDGWSSEGPAALLIHGLGGSHRSAYMVRTAAKLNARGVRTFRLDLRGSGQGSQLACQPGHAGRSEDARTAVEFVERTCPGSPTTLVGFSLGANILLKMLGEWGTGIPPFLTRALAVAPPLDLLACSENMSRRAMTPYNRWFVRCLVEQARGRRDVVPELARFDWSQSPRTLFEFDDRITAPLSGFVGAHDYYARCSAINRLDAIRLPTTILAAADDPIVPVRIFDDRCSTSFIQLRITRRGGHVGYYGRAGIDKDRNWLDWRIVEFVTAAGPGHGGGSGV